METDDDVVRITSNLVQFDAVVADRQGRHVADLRPEEFEGQPRLGRHLHDGRAGPGGDQPHRGRRLQPRAGGAPGFSPVLNRNREFVRNQEGLAYLAEQTGGIFIRNTNDLVSGMERVLDDQSGYYLIGFRPPEEVFQPAQGRTRFNKFEVRLKRPGLSVRTRGEQLMAALSSPRARRGA